MVAGAAVGLSGGLLFGGADRRTTAQGPLPASIPPVPALTREARPTRCTLVLLVSDLSGRAIADAHVEVDGAAAFSAETDADGRVELSALTEGMVDVRVDHPGAGHARDSVLLCPKDRLERRITLGRGPRLSGRVITSAGLGIEAATVTLEEGEAAPRTLLTDRQGGFVFLGVDAGPWILRARAPGFRAKKKLWLEIPPEQAMALVELKLDPSRHIAGRILDVLGVPLPRWDVLAIAPGAQDAAPTRARSDDAGRFVLEDLADGSYTLTASGQLPGGPETLSLEASANAGDDDVLFRVPLAAMIEGEVEFRGPAPPAFYRVRAGRSVLELAGDTSRFALRVLQAGAIEIRAEAEGFEPAIAPVAVTSGGRATARLVLVPRREFRGIVVDHKSVQPIEGVRLQLGGHTLQTRADGRFAFPFEPGIPGVWVSHPRYPVSLEPVVEGENVIDLREGVRVGGSVLAGRMAIPGARVRVERPWDPHEPQETLTDAAGAFELCLPSPGKKRVSIQVPADPRWLGRELAYRWSLEVDVPLEGLARLNLRSGPFAPVLIQVPDLQGAVELGISHLPREEPGVNAAGVLPPGPASILALDQLPPGNYELIVSYAWPPYYRQKTLRWPLEGPLDLADFLR